MLKDFLGKLDYCIKVRVQNRFQATAHPRQCPWQISSRRVPRIGVKRMADAQSFNYSYKLKSRWNVEVSQFDQKGHFKTDFYNQI